MTHKCDHEVLKLIAKLKSGAFGISDVAEVKHL